MNYPNVLALDLEGTLISNAMSQIPRPDLFEFLTCCYELFPRIVMFTTVKEEKFRAIAKLLVNENFAPKWFSNIEYINWEGQIKDLRFITGVNLENILLVDDFEEYIHKNQKYQWIKIDYFDYPDLKTDQGLMKVLHILKQYLK